MGIDIVSVFNPKEEINYKPTNGDKIRSLSDKKLAELLHDVYSFTDSEDDKLCISLDEYEHEIVDNIHDILDWLQQPAE